ncbi:hypothetical protein DFH08DRAFT_959086 [Mycena albidolilacea]|uniref:Uncharacterized protein n=1 Tax=Mycena albidolilacea TaxID=1033008 RepID=A0AAD7A3V1_9AGAR|nr:hypothetical protein DFH08DRAFT_959086 [Mycena albidolilacea]
MSTPLMTACRTIRFTHQKPPITNAANRAVWPLQTPALERARTDATFAQWLLPINISEIGDEKECSIFRSCSQYPIARPRSRQHQPTTRGPGRPPKPTIQSSKQPQATHPEVDAGTRHPYHSPPVHLHHGHPAPAD